MEDSLLWNFLYVADDEETEDCDVVAIVEVKLLLATAVSVDSEAEVCGRSIVVSLASWCVGSLEEELLDVVAVVLLLLLVITTDDDDGTPPWE